MAEKRQGQPRDDEFRLRDDAPKPSPLPDPEEEDTADEEENGSKLAGVFAKLTDTAWIPQNPNVAKGILAVALFLLMMLVFAWQLGWLSSGVPKQGPAVAAQPSGPQTPPPAQPARDQPPKPPEQKPFEQPKKEEPKKPSVPDDVATWKKDDYFRARKENNPKLLEAIARLSERTRGSAPAAQGLAELLKPLPVKRSASTATPPPPPPNQGDLTKLVETIVAALGENGSEPARKTLEQILAATLTTDDDKAAVEATLKALVAHGSAENDALLFRVLVAPEALRPASRQGPWPAKELRTKALELAKSAASSQLRAKLAEALAERFARLDPNDPIRQLLLAPDPLNCAAQMVLYEKGNINKDIRATLEKQLTDYSSALLARLLEISREGQAGAGAAPAGTAEPVSDRQLAGLLWSERFRALLEAQMGKLRLQTQLVLLASTIPQDSTRAALHKLLRKRWDDAPKALESAAAGWADQMITDPGLLVVAKMMPRKEPKAARNAPPARGNKSARAAPAAANAGGKREQAEQDWWNLSSKLVAVWCKRFDAAVAAKEQAAEESGKPVGRAEPKLPGDLKLGPNAKITAALHVLWPDEAPPGIPQLKPGLLEIYYIRAEETNRLKKALGFYGRQVQVRALDAPKIDKATWLDTLRVIPAGDHRQSLDVLITPAEDQTADATKHEEETDLVVQILSIEIKNPASRE